MIYNNVMTKNVKIFSIVAEKVRICCRVKIYINIYIPLDGVVVASC